MQLVIIVALCAFYLGFRNRVVLAPSNVVFGFYLLYLIIPLCTLLIFNKLDWDYELAAAKNSGWETLGQNDFKHLFFVFFTLFLCIRIFEFRGTIEKFLPASSVRARRKVKLDYLAIYTSAIFFMAVWFAYVTGWASWLESYSNTYLTKKAGHGGLNILLITGSNFLAFLLGISLKTGRVKWLKLFFIVSVLLLCAYLQGTKSRVVYFLIIGLSPWLIEYKLSLRAGLTSLALFYVLFGISMYFRSEGYYSSPKMLLEYTLLYFNTSVLHEMATSNFDPGSVPTYTFAFLKWLDLTGISRSDSFMHDMSYFLTAKFFPDQWFLERATQQWPLETEMYLSFGPVAFWIIPLVLYSLYISILYKLARSASSYFLYVFVMEALFLFSILRGGLFTWIVPINLILYLVTFGLYRLMTRKSSNGSLR